MLRIPHIPGFVLSTVNLRGSYESACCFLKFRESFHVKIFRWLFLEKYSKFSEHIPKNTLDQLLLSIQVYIYRIFLNINNVLTKGKKESIFIYYLYKYNLCSVNKILLLWFTKTSSNDYYRFICNNNFDYELASSWHHFYI